MGRKRISAAITMVKFRLKIVRSIDCSPESFNGSGIEWLANDFEQRLLIWFLRVAWCDFVDRMASDS